MSFFSTSKFQFERTRTIRNYVYCEARLSLRSRILEVGSGDGPVAEEMAARTGRTVLALDRAPVRARPGVFRVMGDAHGLPFPSGSLSAVAFHFCLLWLRDPVASLRETRRVLGPGGAVLILSEPDLARRVEVPETGLGTLLAGAIRAAGGEPEAGRQVAGWLREAGFRPRLRETPPAPVAVGDPAELLHEAVFLESLGFDLGSVRGRIGSIYGAGKRVCIQLPLAYGWAVRE
jgi:SAM-dependent methyltransferase